MYERFYGFDEKPFSLLPDPGFLYMGKQHSMAYAMLEYGLTNQAGFTVITGGIGCGKTTLVRHLLEELDDDITVGLISNTQQQVGHLLQWVLMAYGIEYKGRSKVELYEAFYDFLIEEYASNRRTVLIIDEAQNLSPRVLEDFRMLSNINADKDQVIQVILVGQPQLRDLLRRPELEQFAQRIAADYHLDALSSQETAEYIAYRTRQAGVERPVFSKDATDLVYRYTRGVPRLINTLCDTALVYGFAEEAQEISATLIKAVADDKAQTGLLRLDYAAGEQAQQLEPVSTESLGMAGPDRSTEDLSGTARPTPSPEEFSGTARPTPSPEEFSGTARPHVVPSESSGAGRPTHSPEESSGTARPPHSPEDSSGTVRLPPSAGESSGTARSTTAGSAEGQKPKKKLKDNLVEFDLDQARQLFRSLRSKD